MPHRVWVLLLAAGLVAAPAALLRGLCAGRSCDRPASASAQVPFCSLPLDTRELLQAGFHEARSPEVLAVARRAEVMGGSAFPRRGTTPPWPTLDPASGTEVPVVFWGTGVSPGRLPGDLALDDVAPTLARVIGLDRPHPEVRSGAAAAGVAAGKRPRLVVKVIWKGIGSTDLEVQPQEWPFLARLVRAGAATMSASTGSLPLDPAAVLTTIGTGGLPHQHGITGTLVRDDEGELVRAWGRGAPPSVIATLADDLDQATRQGAKVTLVARRTSDRGVIGGNWYVGADRDRVLIGPGVTAAAVRELDRGWGRGGLLAVVDRGPLRALDNGLRSIVRAARRTAAGSVAVVVAGTGSTRPAGARRIAAAGVVERVERRVDDGHGVVEASAPGGLFLDDSVLEQRSLSEDDVVGALRALTAEGRRRLFADAFPALAVSFGRYC